MTASTVSPPLSSAAFHATYWEPRQPVVVRDSAPGLVAGLVTPRMLASVIIDRRTRDYLAYLETLRTSLQQRLDNA